MRLCQRFARRYAMFSIRIALRLTEQLLTGRGFSQRTPSFTKLPPAELLAVGLDFASRFWATFGNNSHLRSSTSTKQAVSSTTRCAVRGPRMGASRGLREAFAFTACVNCPDGSSRQQQASFPIYCEVEARRNDRATRVRPLLTRLQPRCAGECVEGPDGVENLRDGLPTPQGLLLVSWFSG